MQGLPILLFNENLKEESRRLLQMLSLSIFVILNGDRVFRSNIYLIKIYVYGSSNSVSWLSGYIEEKMFNFCLSIVKTAPLC